MGESDGAIRTMKKVRNLIVLCVLALVVTISVLLFMNWRKSALDLTTIKLPTVKADLEVGNLSLAEEKEGVILWELKAKIAERYTKGNRTLLEDLRVTLYGDDGRVVTLRGDRGQIDEASRDMEVDGGVVVTSTDGLRLRTRSLRYSHSQRQISTEAPVEIDGRGVRISGVGLLMDLATERISILRDVDASIHELSSDSG
jgi:lipopolysaccharide export system protein LptC